VSDATSETENHAQDPNTSDEVAGVEGEVTSEEASVKKKWYVATTYSNYENKVKLALMERIRQHKMESHFGEILIPSEQITDTLKSGKQRTRTRITFPGYLFVEMAMGEDAWHIVKDTAKVTGFIGNNRPKEVKPPSIDGLRKGISEGASKPKPKYEFHEGDEVRVVVGAFANFSGTVQEVNADKQKLKVKVSIFGRDTPVELSFSDVERR
jgi:transcriptional antiterminator NusG